MNPLARFYSRFRVGERVLLTGHSHQAWPDAGFDGQQQAWLDAAEFVDDKWGRAEAQAAAVREGFARLLGDRPQHIALGQNTHELVARWLSALPLASRPGIVSTDGEFHSLRRQLDRLGEEPFLDIVRVAARPVESLAERLAAAVTDRTAGVLVSSVLYETAERVPHLDHVADACRRVGAALMVDAYHHLNVIPFDVQALGIADAFITGGGYKYCQLGEGNAFLRVPEGCRMRPLLTGWFAEFEGLADAPDGQVRYGPGAAAFAGATYDPTSHYRAAAVFRFHEEQGLTAQRLHEINRRQAGMLLEGIQALDLDPATLAPIDVPADRRGGFVAVRAQDAASLSRRLKDASVQTDARGQVLRLGPAPYVDDDQLRRAIDALGTIAGGRS